MPKRKRTVEETVEEKVQQFGKELHHALKVAKGYERQRLAKRLRDSKSTPEKIQRLQKELVVLKSLDLHQAAHAHLCASLLRIKSVAESPEFPASLKAGPPKPDISEEERIALHNVSSALYSRKEVREVHEKAIAGICNALGLPVPTKKRQGVGKTGPDARKEKEGQPADRDVTKTEVIRSEKAPVKKAKETPAENISDGEEESTVSRYEAMLGGSSDEEDLGSEGDVEEDPMQVTSDEGEADDGFGDVELDSEEEEEERNEDDEETSFNGFSSDEGEELKVKDGKADRGEAAGAEASEGEEQYDDSSDYSAISRSPSPKRASRTKLGRPTDSTFLPSLMGGYISGSESASDVDIAPPRKNRRGQRARQAIWEKKFKQEAKHLHKESRDQGWDPKRGAVEGESKPWKRGIRNPLENSAGQAEDERPARSRRERSKPDDTGPLHPSWEAKKKAKEMQQTATFQGTKIKFD